MPCAGPSDLHSSSFCPGRQHREVGRVDSRLTPTQLHCWLCLHRLWEPLTKCPPLCQPCFPSMKMGTLAGLMALGAVGFMCARILDACGSSVHEFVLCRCRFSSLSPSSIPVDFLTQTNPCTLCISSTPRSRAIKLSSLIPPVGLHGRQVAGLLLLGRSSVDSFSQENWKRLDFQEVIPPSGTGAGI